MPLSPKAIEILSHLPKGSAGATLIFASRAGSPLCRNNLIRRQLKPTAARLGIADVNWHWFRHATASLVAAAGAPLGTIANLLGHASSQVTREVYLHEVPSETRIAVEKMERMLIGPQWTQVSVESGGASSAIH